MGADENWDAKVTANPNSIKVHRSMCSSLIKVVQTILRILPQIEESRPGSSSGIQSLCSLNTGLDKANSLFNHCADSSKLYLALTGDVLLQRFKRTRNLLSQSLNQIQEMVPVTLATEISVIISNLKNVKFALNLCEEEAGKVMQEFVQKGISPESDSKAVTDVMRFAASRLSITSEKELMIEIRSIRKLIDKVGAGEPTKRNILVYLLNILKDHGQTIVTDLTDSYVPNDEDNENFSFTSVEEEYGLVVDSSSSCTSIASLRSCFNNLHLPSDLSNVSLNDNFTDNFLQKTVEDESKNKLLVEKLDSLPWELQCSMVEDLENQMRHNQQLLSSTDVDVLDQLLRFVKEAFGVQDSRALKTGCGLLSTCFRKFRSCSSNFQAYELLASLLGYGATEEALSIIEALSCHEDCKYTIAASTAFSPVLKLLVESDSKQIQKSAIIILKNLSSNKDTHTFVDSCNLIPTLTRFFEDVDLAAHSITLFDNFCQNGEFTTAVSETDGFIDQIAKLLEFESREVQEHAVSVLHSLCTQQGQSFQLAKNEEIIPSLITISVNSNEKVKEKARVVLQQFHEPEIQVVQEQRSGSEFDMEKICRKQFSEKKSTCRRTVLGMKIPLFSKRASSLARK